MLIRQFTTNVLAILSATPAVATPARAEVEDLCRSIAERLDALCDTGSRRVDQDLDRSARNRPVAMRNRQINEAISATTQ